MSNVKDRIKLFEKKETNNEATTLQRKPIRRKLSSNKTAWNNNDITSNNDTNSYNGLDKYSPQTSKSPKEEYASKFSTPIIPVVADEEIDFSSKNQDKKKILQEKIIVNMEGKESDDNNNINKNNGDKINNGKEKERITPIKIVKTDFSFKRDQSSPKHEFSSVKLPDHLEKIRRKQRSLKKSSKKAKKKKERRSEKMKDLHSKLGKQLKFQEQFKNTLEEEKLSLNIDDNSSSPINFNKPKTLMTPSMKDFMKRLEKKDSITKNDNKSNINNISGEEEGEEELSNTSSKENSPPIEHVDNIINFQQVIGSKENEAVDSAKKNNTDGTVITKSENINNEKKTKLPVPTLLSFEDEDNDNEDGDGKKTVGHNNKKHDNSSKNNNHGIGRKDFNNEESEKRIIKDPPSTIMSQEKEHTEIEIFSETNHQYDKELCLSTVDNDSKTTNDVSKSDNIPKTLDNHSHLHEEINRLRSELESVKSARNVNILNREKSSGGKEMQDNNATKRPKSSREKMEERKETARKMLQVAHSVGKKKSVKWAYHNRFCLPSCGKLKLEDSKGEIFARIVAQLWLHIVCGFFMLFISIVAVTTYSWTPQFSRAPTGMSLLVLTFLKAITSAIVVASIYRNIDTAACMFPFYSCFHTKYEPMIIYEKAWLRGITYTKIFDFIIGIWTWAAYVQANNFVGRPRTSTLDFVMTWIFFTLFFLDIWAVLLIADLGLIVKSWLAEMPDNHVRDGYTLHGFMDDGDSDTEDDSDSDDGGELFVDENNKTRKSNNLNHYNGTPRKQNSARAAKETPRTPLSKQDSARLWGAKTERGIDRPSFVPKLALGGKGKSAKTKPRVSHLSGLPKFPKISKPKNDSSLDSIDENRSPKYKNSDHDSGNMQYHDEHEHIYTTDNCYPGEVDASDEWEPHLDQEGNQYYVSKYTGESVWEIPQYSAVEDHTVSIAGADLHHDNNYEDQYLSVNNEILPHDFEGFWTKMKINSTVMMELHSVPAPSSVIGNVSAKGFRVIASGVKGNKFTVYLYGKNYNEDVQFFSEIRFDSITRHMTAVFKCDHKPKLKFFLGMLRIKDLCSLS